VQKPHVTDWVIHKGPRLAWTDNSKLVLASKPDFPRSDLAYLDEPSDNETSSEDNSGTNGFVADVEVYA
jgi:hypothetical protein